MQRCSDPQPVPPAGKQQGPQGVFSLPGSTSCLLLDTWVHAWSCSSVGLLGGNAHPMRC